MSAPLTGPKLTGPKLAPASGHARQLIVFLHGYGADGNDLINIGKQWAKVFPDAAFAAPNAPQRCTAGGGYQWFPLTFRDPDERWKGVQAARPTLDAYLDAELAALGLTDSQLALVGFSQGTMVALHAGLRRKSPPAAIVGYSGTLEGAHALKSEATGKPPILLVHGGRDDVVPVDALFAALDGLCQADIPAQWHLAPQLGHGIDADGLMHGAMLLAESFRIRLGR